MAGFFTFLSRKSSSGAQISGKTGEGQEEEGSQLRTDVTENAQTTSETRPGVAAEHKVNGNAPPNSIKRTVEGSLPALHAVTKLEGENNVNGGSLKEARGGHEVVNKSTEPESSSAEVVNLRQIGDGASVGLKTKADSDLLGPEIRQGESEEELRGLEVGDKLIKSAEQDVSKLRVGKNEAGGISQEGGANVGILEEERDIVPTFEQLILLESPKPTLAVRDGGENADWITYVTSTADGDKQESSVKMPVNPALREILAESKDRADPHVKEGSEQLGANGVEDHSTNAQTETADTASGHGSAQIMSVGPLRRTLSSTQKENEKGVRDSVPVTGNIELVKDTLANKRSTVGTALRAGDVNTSAPQSAVDTGGPGMVPLKAPPESGVNALVPDVLKAGTHIDASGLETSKGSGIVGNLMRRMSSKNSEGEERGVTRGNGLTNKDLAALRIPQYLLPGKERDAGLMESEGVETSPLGPLLVFVDSQAAGPGGGELQYELSTILGGGQIIDVSQLSPAEFIGELLPQIDERAQRGDRIAATVRDRLRILVVGGDSLLKSVIAALQSSPAGKSIAVGCVPAGGRSEFLKALGLSLGGSVVSKESVSELLKQVVNAGTQNVDCWEVSLSNHRKRLPNSLPTSLKSVSVEGSSDWVVSHQGLCWASLHLEMGYVTADKEGETRSAGQKKSWLCGLCSTPEPEVIRSQTVGRLEIKRGGAWSYLELSPQIQALEFLNLVEDTNKERRKMKMLERGNLDAFSDDGMIEIVGVKDGSDEEICLAQANAVRLELTGNVEIDHVKLRLDSETWTQPLAGESTTHPTVIQIDNARHAPVLVSQTSTLKCTTDPVFRAPLFVPPKVEALPPEKAPGLFRRSASPFRRSGRFRSASPFRKGGSFRRSRSPAQRRMSEAFEPTGVVRDASYGVRNPAQGAQDPSHGVRTPSQSVRELSDGVRTSSQSVREPSVGLQATSKPVPVGLESTEDGGIAPSPARPISNPRPSNGGFFGSKNRMRAQSPVPGARIHDDREVRAAALSDASKRPVSAPPTKSPNQYSDAAAAAVKREGVKPRRPSPSIPWTLKADKMVDADKVQPQQKVGRTLSGSGSGRQEIIEPVAKTLVRTGSGRLAGDDPSRPPSPALYRSSSRENLEQALSRPPSPALFRSASRENIEQMGGSHSRPPSPSPLSRQGSGNAGFSPRVAAGQVSPRAESAREGTPERLPRMAEWATGMSRKPASMVYHTHLLTKQEREQVVASGFGSSLSREERERMQSLAFGNTPGYDRGTPTPLRIRSARARYITPAGAMYSVAGPLELDLATSDERTASPPPPVRTARDYFSGPLSSSDLPSVRRSAAM